MAYFHLLAYLLARFGFVATHVVFLYWVNFLLNDPFNLGTNTLDYKVVKPPGECTPFIWDNAIVDLELFALWWGSHSILARNAVKKALGLYEHPLDRPLFAAIASVVWGVNVFYWRPISDCQAWNPLNITPFVWAISGTIIVLGALLIVAFLWYLPDHVFGTAKYLYPPHKFPKSTELIQGFPYGLVRHPAASGFLWIYWSLPAYTYNHLFLTVLWTIFILVGTLVFEEGGLKGSGEFGRKYLAYKQEVPAFCPYPSNILKVFGGPAKRGPKIT